MIGLAIPRIWSSGICSRRMRLPLRANDPVAHPQEWSNRKLYSSCPVQPLIQDTIRGSNHVRSPRGRLGDAKSAIRISRFVNGSWP